MLQISKGMTISTYSFPLAIFSVDQRGPFAYWHNLHSYFEAYNSHFSEYLSDLANRYIVGIGSGHSYNLGIYILPSVYFPNRRTLLLCLKIQHKYFQIAFFLSRKKSMRLKALAQMELEVFAYSQSLHTMSLDDHLFAVINFVSTFIN